MDQQLNEATDPPDYTISIRALRRGTHNVISSLLNPIKVIPNENGLPRDWQGLAELCRISGEKIPSIQQDSDPTSKVLTIWYTENKDECTIHTFIAYLEELDRFDVIEDITHLIEEDIKYYKQNPSGCKNLNTVNDKYALTVDDVSRISEGLEPQMYDAFVLFADEDIDFVSELIETMEKNYNLKFCVKGRDLLGGRFEHDSIVRLISERCRKLIVIVSPSFLNSSANTFFYNFAQAIGLEQRQDKIVPCLYKPCGKLPPEISMYVMLDYERLSKVWKNFWHQLYRAIGSQGKNPASIENGNLVRSVSERIESQRENQHENTDTQSLTALNHVKFKSMVELNTVDNNKILPNGGISESNSADNLEVFPEKTRNASFYKRIKKIIKVKTTKHEETSETEEAANANADKKKKRTFFKKSSKKKVALAN